MKLWECVNKDVPSVEEQNEKLKILKENIDDPADRKKFRDIKRDQKKRWFR